MAELAKARATSARVDVFIVRVDVENNRRRERRLSEARTEIVLEEEMLAESAVYVQ